VSATAVLARRERYRRWLPYGLGTGGRDLRLFCLPHVGGGASAFAGWIDPLAPAVDVCPVQSPGRENRLGEPPMTRMDELVDALASALLPFLDVPFALLGHSMGGIVGYELAGELWRRYRLVPSMLIVSSSSAPHLVDHGRTALEGLSDAEFVRTVHKTYGGIPDALADQPQLLAAFLPALRGDMALMDSYRPLDRPPVRAPLLVLGGTEDRAVPPAVLEPWSEYAARGFTLRMLPGGHFHPFTGDRFPELLADQLRKGPRS
jgi:pyochelin biosynthesis protein PchC